MKYGKNTHIRQESIQQSLRILKSARNISIVWKQTVDGKAFVTARGWEDLFSAVKSLRRIRKRHRQRNRYLQHLKIAKKILLTTTNFTRNTKKIMVLNASCKDNEISGNDRKTEICSIR